MQIDTILGFQTKFSIHRSRTIVVEKISPFDLVSGAFLQQSLLLSHRDEQKCKNYSNKTIYASFIGNATESASILSTINPC